MRDRFSIRATKSSSILFCFALIVSLLVVASDPSGRCTAADSFETRSLPSDSIQIGIDGVYRVGRWTQISFPVLDASAIRDDATSWTLETRDGDSTPVQFNASLQSLDGKANEKVVYAMIKSGAEAAPLLVRENDDVRYDGRLPAIGSLSDRPTMIAESKPWIVAIGGSLGLENLGVNVINKDPVVAVSKIQNASMLPRQSIGWDGVDLILINPDAADFIGDISKRQSDALIQWVRDGGRVMMMLGGKSKELLATAPWLKTILPFSPDEIVTLNPSGLETFMSSQTPLKPYLGIRLPKDAGQILVRGRTSRRIPVSLASKFNVGFGEVTVLAADLDHGIFRKWPERMDLLNSLTGSVLVSQSLEQTTKTSIAYDDLAGQLRNSMDQYDAAIRMDFSVLSLIILGLIALIGPIDYWFINRICGRPLLGWLTFPITAIGLSVLLVMFSDVSASVPTEKKIDVLDIDLSNAKSDSIDVSAGSTSRVTMLSHLYSKEAVRLDAILKPSNWLARSQSTNHSAFLSAFGHPSTAFGGIRLSSEDERIGAYQVGMTDGQTLPRLTELPLPPRSSKSLIGQLNVTPPTNGHRQSSDNGVQRRRGSELLQGPLTNPLDVDILDGRLVYQNWVYLLPTRFVAGGTIAKIDVLRQKNFRWLLSRQKALESASQTEAWMPTSLSSDRVLEMMLFHEAAGGSDYTSLHHRPLGHLDLSHVLSSDRCLIVGRLEAPACELEFTDTTSQSKPAIELETTSMVRILLPAAFDEDE